MPNFNDITDQRFGRLLVTGFAGRNKHNQSQWLCQCDCGNATVVTGCGLVTGDSTSCGCRVREQLRKARYKHGYSIIASPEYKAWKGMRGRCNNPQDHAYKNYGGRGIKICVRWSDFRNFLADMGPRLAGRSIDRINNDGDYKPSNCRWATRSQQMKNRRPQAIAGFKKRWHH